MSRPMSRPMSRAISRPASRRRAAAAALGLVVALPLAVSGVPAGAAPTLPVPPTGTVGPDEPTTGPAADLRTTEVTLVTGDRVLVAPQGPDGPPFELQPAVRDSGTPGFAISYDEEALYVIPNDVLALVADGVLDRELFNITALVEMGYDDRGTDLLPLIVEHAAGADLEFAAESLRTVRSLPSIGATAVRFDRSAGDAFRAALTNLPSDAGGIERIWLDAAVVSTEPTRTATPSDLDPNLEQIDAPAAWAAGLSGAGTTVAVLSTGVDAEHPDLAGQVVAEVNFSGAETVDDVLGNGTHTASLIAGTGAASGGTRQGVAFGADLLSAKVLDDFGSGLVSDAIAAMEWAVDQGADVVDIDFNGYPAAGPDLVRQAVEDLTAETGTLFVAPAGDVFFIPGPFSILSPGDAPSALTVGAATADDTLASVSGRGPTGDYGLKPDLLAPGIEITGAIPGDTPYGVRTGTATAAAHGAGAAALLLEQHPDWGPEQLTSVLIGNAARLDDTFVFEQGGGRLDLGLAVEQSLVAEPATLDFGLRAHPQDEPTTQQLTVANTGDQPVTVDLDVTLEHESGSTVADGLVTFADTELTVPPAGSASTQVTVHPVDAVDPGAIGGQVTVTLEDGDSPAIQVPLGLYWEPERYDVTVQVLDDTGQPYVGGGVNAIRKESFVGGFFPYEELDDNGEMTVRVAPGHYAISSAVSSPSGSFALVAESEVLVDADTSLVLDAREALPVAVGVDGLDTTITQAELTYTIGEEGLSRLNYYSYYPPPADVEAGLVRATPTSLSEVGTFALTTRWQLEGDTAQRSDEAQGVLYDLIFQSDPIPDPPAYIVTPEDEAELARFDARYYGTGEPSERVWFRAYWTDLIPVATAFNHPLNTPVERTEYATAREDFTFYACAYVTPSSTARTCEDSGPYEAGRHGNRHWLQAVHPTPRLLQRWDDTTIFADIGFADAQHIGPGDYQVWETSQLHLWSEGELLDSWDSDYAYFTVPPGKGRYTLIHEGELLEGTLPAATTSLTKHRFTSDLPTDPQQWDIAILDLGYRPIVPLMGAAPPEERLPIKVQVHRRGSDPSDAPIEITKVWVSADEGTTWERLRARPHAVHADRYTVRVPADLVQADGTLSLRTRFVDGADNMVRSTVHDLIPIAEPSPRPYQP